MRISRHVRRSRTRQHNQRRKSGRSQKRRLLLESLEVRNLLATVGWDGGGDGTSWHDPLNWDTDALPAVADDVVIDIPGDVTVRHTTGATEVNSLTLAEDFELVGGALHIPTDVTTSGVITMLNGSRLLTAKALVRGIGDGRLEVIRGTLDGVVLDIPATVVIGGVLEIENDLDLFSQITVQHLIPDHVQALG